MSALTLDKLLQLDDRTIFYGADANGKPYLPQMLKLYADTFGQNCFSCSSKYPHYLQKLRAMANKKNTPKTEEKKDTPKKENKEQQFFLQEDVLLPIFGTTKSYTSENMTDEVAIRFLKENPNRISLFKKYPKNWEEIIK